jgi:hypothetical protein
LPIELRVSGWALPRSPLLRTLSAIFCSLPVDNAIVSVRILLTRVANNGLQYMSAKVHASRSFIFCGLKAGIEVAQVKTTLLKDFICITGVETFN